MFNEKPPMLSGNSRADLISLRDYLFRMAGSLEALSSGNAETGSGGVSIVYGKDGTQALKPRTTAEEIRQNAEELKALIIKTANQVIQYADSKVEEYNQLYVAQSEYGEFTETITSTIESTARGVVESYDYDASIQSAQDSIGMLQSYLTTIDGEIRRGIVLDPSTNPPTYVTGIAISQSLQFSGQVCDTDDPNHPQGDNYDYYYINAGQTFGLYTSTGWQFWIEGRKVGWYSSDDSLLHVAGVIAEQTIQLGSKWAFEAGPGANDIQLRYIG